MKKITVLFLCAALLAAASCGYNSNSNKGKSEEPKAATKTEAGKKMDIGDKFDFAGLESSKLVPACAKEVSELQTPVRSESRPMKDAAYFYTGTASTDITIQQLDEFLATAYNAAKAAASDGKVYKRGSYGDTKLGAEITEPYKCTSSKPLADWSCVYKHDGLWYSLTVRHARQDEKFKKEYPGNYCGFAIIVTEYFIDE